jgi:branched-chain amino acid transport system substrate-binding protein
MILRNFACILASSLALFMHVPVAAEKIYGPGASDTVIKIGQTMPYSGPASAYATIGKVQAAYFAKVNEEGGINGRKIEFISLDDGYSPPRTVEVTRRLVEQERVLLLFQTLGTPTSTAVHQYMNSRKVPQLFVSSGATKWNDPKRFPWTMGWQANYQTELQIYARHILRERPAARIAVLYQNDDFGKDALKGLKDGLGASAASMIVAEASYEVSAPTVDSQVVQLKSSGADVFVNIATPKFAAQAIRKAYDLGWKPLQYLNNSAQSVAAVLMPAGLERSRGIVTSIYNKDPSDPRWARDDGMAQWRSFMNRYYPGGSQDDILNVYGYAAARALVQVLKQCGDNLTRENVMREAANLKNFETGTEMPGIRINTSPSSFAPMQDLQLVRFDGRTWVSFGEVINVGDR